MSFDDFPNLKIVKGTIDENGTASNKALGNAVAWADFLLHGSGPSLVAAPDVADSIEQLAVAFNDDTVDDVIDPFAAKQADLCGNILGELGRLGVQYRFASPAGQAVPAAGAG